jgi:hypothetical protein
VARIPDEVMASAHRLDAHRRRRGALTRNTRLLTVRRANRVHFRTASAAGTNHCPPSTRLRQPPSAFRCFELLGLRHWDRDERARVDGCRSTATLPRPRSSCRELASAPRALAGSPRQGRQRASLQVTPGSRLDLRQNCR